MDEDGNSWVVVPKVSTLLGLGGGSVGKRIFFSGVKTRFLIPATCIKPGMAAQCSDREMGSRDKVRFLEAHGPASLP